MKRFDELWREIEPYVALVDERKIDDVAMTFFEIITAMAYAAFADAPVDVAVVEVGLGGAWDATNVADADVAVVTPIDLDHTHMLGHDHPRSRVRRPASSSRGACHSGWAE
jgi:dihydrofolate synthase/folylpolyglutamate synthase